MTARQQRGATLAIGLALLTLVTLLGLAGANSAHVELLLAQNERFRENAASAASAGVEFAISNIVTAPDLSSTPHLAQAFMEGSAIDRWETATRFMGYETDLPQEPNARLVGAHFEISSTGFSARRAIDHQRAGLMLVVPAPAGAGAAQIAPPCDATVPALRCWQAGEWRRTFWLRPAS